MSNRKERVVVLTFDAMYLREHVEYCRFNDRVFGVEEIDANRRTKATAQALLVFMIRSVFGGWTHIVGHHFTRSSYPKEELEKTIMSYLHHLHDANFEVKAIVCDQEPSHVSLFRSLGVNREKPFIKCPSCFEKIFVIFDPPHLLKSTRNNLINNDFVVSKLKQ